MEETIPILHSGFVRCNTYCSKNPYGAKVSRLRVVCLRALLFVLLPPGMTAQEPARYVRRPSLQ
jgi:hypothetical protein